MANLKQYIVRLFDKFVHRRNQPDRALISLQEASSAGILFSIDDDAQYEELSAMVKQLKDLKKKVSVITYVETSGNLLNSLKYNAFNDKAIKANGSFTDKEVREFVDTPFDILFCIGKDHPEIFDSILIQCKARCRVGRHIQSKEDLFELMVQPSDHSTRELIAQMLHYTRLI